MFSYRHAFHAGNHADVLKHSIFVQILNYFNQKPAPYCVIDTHAGAGLYNLNSDWALKNAEFIDGLDRLLDGAAMPPMIEQYLHMVQEINPDGIASFYPGSPWLALNCLRKDDRLRLFEMHPAEAGILKQNLEQQGRLAARQTIVYEDDGFNGLKALLPPLPRRSIVIIDPSYENKLDYRRSILALNEALIRHASGCYMIWYPLVQRRESQELARSLERLKVNAWVHATLTVRKPAGDGLGLHGSGVFVINPPWTLYRELQKTLPWLSKKLAQDDRAGFTLNQRVS